MDALVQLRRIARAFAKVRLEAIMVGNAAAALQGAPVTTLDFDFYYRHTPANLRKLKHLTRELGGVLLSPFYPVSTMMRLEVDSPPLQIDFLSTASGVSSFASLRSRAVDFAVEGDLTLRLACLADIVRSKTAAARPKASPCCPPSARHSKRHRAMSRRRPDPQRQLEDLARASEALEREQIRALLRKPMIERTHFLRVRLPWGLGTTL
jgi:hypothetical protein